MGRTLEEIIATEDAAVVEQAKERAKEILGDKTQDVILDECLVEVHVDWDSDIIQWRETPFDRQKKQ